MSERGYSMDDWNLEEAGCSTSWAVRVGWNVASAWYHSQLMIGNARTLSTYSSACRFFFSSLASQPAAWPGLPVLFPLS